jgi:hypothetical protein
VAVFAPQFFQPAGFLERLAARFERPGRHIVVGASIADDPTLLGTTKGALSGVVGSSFSDPARMATYLRAYEQAFPGTPASVAAGELVTGYRDAVQGLVMGLEKADGNSDELPAALASLHLDLLGGPVRLDDNRQAVVSTSLVRIEPPGTGEPDTADLRTISDVDQSVGGLLSPSSQPSDLPAKCQAGRRPPPWAS